MSGQRGENPTRSPPSFERPLKRTARRRISSIVSTDASVGGMVSSVESLWPAALFFVQQKHDIETYRDEKLAAALRATLQEGRIKSPFRQDKFPEKILERLEIIG